MAEVLTFGCRLNAVEAEAIAAATASDDRLVVINTCAVTAEAVRQARQAIRRKRREIPEARIVVTGCAAQVDPAGFAVMPEVDRVLGNAEKLSGGVYAGAGRIAVADIFADAGPPAALAARETRTRAVLRVQTGCDHRCTFCVIPFGRGAARSVPLAEAAAAAARLVEAGAREIVLTGVDLTSWGADLPGLPGLGRLVRAVLAAAPALERLRLSSIDSVEADDTLLGAIADEPRLMPYLHLSLQSGDDLILKRMKRRHSRADAVRFCDTVRRLRPDIALGADLIAGFPTETEEQFRRSLDLVEDCGLTQLHVFPFSPRPGTPAARMPAVRTDVVRERAARLRDAGRAAWGRRLAAELGRTRRVLVERGGLARTEAFMPMRFDHPIESGSFVEARVVGCDDDVLVGAAA